ncbi:MAG: hypothetical protein ACKVOM_11415 [Ferruginibacter sp.]
MNYVAITAIIEAYKVKRKRQKKENPTEKSPIIYDPSAMQTKMEM